MAIYICVMTRLCGGLLAYGKANYFLEGLQVDEIPNWSQHLV